MSAAAIMTLREEVSVIQAQQVIDQVEAMGGAFKLENYFEENPRLLYKLGSARENPELAARVESKIVENREFIGMLISMRNFLAAWQTQEEAVQ